jgi:hypothetical protein
MSRRDRLSAVDLLDQHDAGEKVRPGQSSERQRVIGAGDHLAVQPLGATDEKADRPPRSEPAFQQARQFFAVRQRAAGIQRHHEGRIGQCAQQRLALATLHLRGRPTRFRNLDHCDFRPQPRIVAGKEFGLRPVAQPADSKQAQHLLPPLAVGRGRLKHVSGP